MLLKLQVLRKHLGSECAYIDWVIQWTQRRFFVFFFFLKDSYTLLINTSLSENPSPRENPKSTRTSIDQWCRCKNALAGFTPQAYGNICHKNTWNVHKNQTETIMVSTRLFLPDPSWFPHLVRMPQELRGLVIQDGRGQRHFLSYLVLPFHNHPGSQECEKEKE